MIRGLVLCLALALPIGAWSQEEETPAVETLTLEQALTLALANNVSVQNAVLDVDKASEHVAVAQTRRLPELNFSVLESRHLTRESYEYEAGVFGTFPLIGPVPHKTTNIETAPHFTTLVTTGASLPLSQQYRIGLNIRQREVGRDLAKEQVRSQRQRVAEEVKQTYYGIQQTESALGALAETLTFLRELDHQVEQYVKARTALTYESLDVKTRLASAEYEELRQRNLLASQKEHLNDLLGRDARTAFRVSPTSEAPFAKLSPEVAQAEALAQRPEVRAARLKVQHAEYDVRIKKSEYLPDVSFTVRYTSPFGVKLLPENVASVGIYATWEFFDWGRKRHELAEKGAALTQAQNSVRDAENQVVTEVNTRIRKLQDALAQVRVATASQTAAREKVRVMLEQYGQRAALLQNVLQAQDALAKANNEYQQAQLAVWTARANLEKALGEE